MSGRNGPKADQQIDPSVWIAPSAQLYGAISIGRDASVWHNAVLRAECERIEIGRMTNLQDFAMVHIAYDNPTIIGEFCSITHHATVHGCTIGDNTLVGMGATILNGAVIGNDCLIGAGAVADQCDVVDAVRLEPGQRSVDALRRADRRILPFLVTGVRYTRHL